MILHLDNTKLASLLKRVLGSKYSQFYAKHLATIDSDTPVDKLPFLERHHLVHTPPDERLYIDQDDVRFVGYTSGTTSGSPLMSYFGEVSKYFFEPSLGTGVRRPLIVYPPLNKNYGHSFIQQCRQASCPVTPVFADYQNLANSAILARMARCDAVYATPTIALQLASYLQKYHDVNAIKLVAVASEFLSDTKYQQLKQLYPAAYIANLYASSEIGQFIMHTSVSDMQVSKNQFALLSDALIAAELIDGELVVTYDLNPAFPLIRYKTGDYFDVVQTHDDITLRMRGRFNVDMVRFAGCEIRSESVDAFCVQLPVQLQDYQLHIKPDPVEPSHIILILEVVPQKSHTDPATVAGIITDAFRQRFQISQTTSVGQAMQHGVIRDARAICLSTVSHQGAKKTTLVNHLDT